MYGLEGHFPSPIYLSFVLKQRTAFYSISGMEGDSLFEGIAKNYKYNHFMVKRMRYDNEDDSNFRKGRCT